MTSTFNPLLSTSPGKCRITLFAEAGDSGMGARRLEETRTKRKVQAWKNGHVAAGGVLQGKRQHKSAVTCRR